MPALNNQSLVIDHVVSSTAQFVGRESELTCIWHQYKAAKEGSARVVLLVGEQGVGKTRLLEEFAQRAVQDGATVLHGIASEAEGMPPYLPFLEALGQHIRMAPLDQLRAQVEGVPPLLANILPELAVRLGQLSLPYPLPPEQMRLRLYEAIGIFLEKMSNPYTLVLTLDDLQWADSASLDLLCHIVRFQARARLLILGTYRQGETERNLALQRAINKLVRQRVLTSIAVEPLSAEEIEALAVSCLRGSINPMLSHLLFIQSEGNAFFAEELIHSWMEKGELVHERETGQWTAAAPLEHALPQSIVGVLRQRFTRLSPEIIDHLRIAAIIGRTFEPSLLAAIAGQEVELLEEHLLQAAHTGLIRADQAGAFTFSHDKIRECLSAEMSISRRRRLHEAISRILEARLESEAARAEERKMTAGAAQAANRLLTLSQQPLPPRLFPADLTRSETKVLQLVTRGKSNRRIAQDLGISEKTVANHLTHIFAKTESDNRAAATAFAIRHKLA